jgi:hypothetical protein
MKRLIYAVSILFIGLFLVAFTMIPNSSSIVKGEVIWEGRGCDFYIIETSQWYVLVEVYSGTLYEDDIVEGELHSYNFKYLKNKSRGDREVKVWVENYWSSKERCFEWLKDHDKCGLGD